MKLLEGKRLDPVEAGLAGGPSAAADLRGRPAGDGWRTAHAHGQRRHANISLGAKAGKGRQERFGWLGGHSGNPAKLARHMPPDQTEDSGAGSMWTWVGRGAGSVGRETAQLDSCRRRPARACRQGPLAFLVLSGDEERRRLQRGSDVGSMDPNEVGS